MCFGGGMKGCKGTRKLGDLRPTTNAPLKISPKYQDPIMFYPPTTKGRIFEIFARASIQIIFALNKRIF